ncbi:PepSY domain-containing protein [Sphingomonas gilva]|uniref:PepSY domain-containing protein n=1 Tax=Sphingomonas gilva TaxID=2305907 RepID=A0A396RMC2_9SPHN|nr:PepSY domain-containing protein [Sphingomonas gilva]RHW16796.1 PepSY domain-containing protein [Sphingomonas gilva]
MSGSLRRAVWRWHMFAGLIVLPVLAWMAVTGALYLYKPEIERRLYADWLTVEAGAPLSLAAIQARVEAETGGHVTQFARPGRPEAWRLTVATPEGDRTAFVDPGDGRVLGMTAKGGAMAVLRELHSLVIAGPIANAVTEIVAGWAIILVLTGLWMWWPRCSLSVRGPPGDRRFWRDLHSSIGAAVGVVILFLALTGMTWTGVWGKGLQTLIAAAEAGRPKSPGPNPWEAHGGHGAETLPWSRQAMAAPHGGGAAIGPDRVAAIAEARGLAAPWTITVPRSHGAPWLVARMATRAADAHVIYIDGADGRVLQDARYAAFGAGAKAVEWGIAVHEGREYGEANRLVMLAGAIGLLLLCVTAPVLWWKRRPSPAPRGNGRDAKAVATIMLAVGVIFPLTGLTMLAAMLGEATLARLRP